MAEMSDTINEYRRVSIEEARKIQKDNLNVSILWRPEENLPEHEQYALIFNEQT